MGSHCTLPSALNTVDSSRHLKILPVGFTTGCCFNSHNDVSQVAQWNQETCIEFSKLFGYIICHDQNVYLFTARCLTNRIPRHTIPCATMFVINQHRIPSLNSLLCKKLIV